MREIGSEFWDVPINTFANAIFPEHTQWFLSGRSALQSITKELPNGASIAMPSWCCDSMVKPFIDEGMKVHFYPVYFKNCLVQEIDLSCDVLFLMDFFGYSRPQPDLSNYKGIIIRDVTHSIFSSTYSDADYFFGSLRKWCGVWTGGYAWTKDRHKLFIDNNNDFGYVALREKAMHQKQSYIHGRCVAEKSYLELFESAEEVLDHVGIGPANLRDIELAKKLDVEAIISKRRSNADVLRKSFSEWVIFSETYSTDTPMFVPILVPEGKRDDLRRFLIENDIYCPIHWPVSAYHRIVGDERYLYENELSLVCDQRYNKEDMSRMVETIKTFWKEM